MMAGSVVYGFGIGAFNFGFIVTGITMIVTFCYAWLEAIEKVKHWEFDMKEHHDVRK
jgi:hypothetical protein